MTDSHRALSQSDEKRLVARREEGLSLDTLAVEFDVSKSTVRNILKRHGVGTTNEKYSGKKALTDEDEKQIVIRYSNGESALSISYDFPVHADTIRNTLKRHGVPIRPDLAKPRLIDTQRELIVKACQDGSTVSATAERFGTSEATVARILRQHRANEK